MKDPRRRRLFPLAALALGLLLAAFVGELGMRAYLAYLFRGRLEKLAAAPPSDPNAEVTLGDLVYPVADDDLVMRLIPGAVGVFQGAPVRINALGFRDDDAAAEKPLGTIRVLVLGDSNSFGWGVAMEEGYAEVLEASLARLVPAGSRVEVVNTSVPGYNAVMEAALLREAALALAPDAVIIQYSHNDAVLPDFILERPYFSRFDRLYLADLPGMLAGGAEKLVGSTAALKRTGIQYHVEFNSPGWMDPRDVPPRYRHHLGMEAVERAYRAAQAICAERGIPLLVVFPAELAVEWDPAATFDPHYQPARELCGRLGLKLVETFPATREFVLAHGLTSQKLALDPPRDWHATPLRHAIMARAILPEISAALPALAIAPGALDGELAAMRARELEMLAGLKPPDARPAP